jgi:hypothetical protein
MTQWGLDTLFNPAKRHMDEEKRRLQSTREEVGDNSGGKRIDLESGAVTISKPSADDSAGSDEDSAAPASPETAAGSSAKPERKDETPAQARARERRKRSAR